MLASPLLGIPRIKRPKAETDPTEKRETHAMRLYMPRIIKLVETRCSRLLYWEYLALNGLKQKQILPKKVRRMQYVSTCHV